MGFLSHRTLLATSSSLPSLAKPRFFTTSSLVSMRAILVKDGKGPASSLYMSKPDEVPTPKRQHDSDVLVKVKAFGLNRMDVLQRSGPYPVPPGASTVLGVEFSGLVEEAPASSSFKKGDKVFGLTTGGAYAEYVLCPDVTLFKFPEQPASPNFELDFATAAAIPEVWFTATQVVSVIGKLAHNEKFMFHAGASGVGIAAIQIAQGLGAQQIYATVGSDEKKKFIKNLQVDFHSSDAPRDSPTEIIPINYNTEDFEKVIAEHSDGGINLIVDPVGGAYFQRNIRSLTREGRLVLMGLMSGGFVPPEEFAQGNNPPVSGVDISLIVGKALRVEGSTLRSRSNEYKLVLRNEFETKVLPRILNGEFKILIEKEFDWKDIQAAHELMETNTTKGKIVVHVS